MAPPAPARAPLGPRHGRVQRLRRLAGRAAARREEGAFLVEGAQLVAAALEAGAELEGLYVAPEGAGEPVVARARRAGLAVHALAPGVLERVSTTVAPQPVLAVARRSAPALDSLAGASLVVVGVEVRDPGNAGTVVRCAEAAGAGGVVLCGSSVDVTGPKFVRASAGSVFHLPVVEGGDPAVVMAGLAHLGLRRLGAVAAGGVAPDEEDLSGRVALVLGNEAHGLPSAVTGHLDGLITIPMVGATASLNVAMAAAVLCFEAARQRRRTARAAPIPPLAGPAPSTLPAVDPTGKAP